jgi:hypothetical protein
MAFDNSGTPYLAYTDASLLKTVVVMFNGSNWVNVGGSGVYPGVGQYVCLAFNNNRPYVAFADLANSGKATVVMYNGSGWVNVGSPDFSISTAINLSLAFNNGVPYLAYSDGANGNKATVMTYQ